MNQRRLGPAVLLVSMVLVAVGAIAAWIAVGGLANGTERALQRMEAALVAARDLADSTAKSASELESAVGVVGDGLASTSDALKATQDVSKSLRGVLGLLDFIGSVDNLKKSLEEAESSLVFVQGSLNTASNTLDDAVPVLHDTVQAIADIPDQIDAALADAAEARDKIDNQLWLWRLAIVAFSLAIIGGLWGVRSYGRRVDSLFAAVAGAPLADA